MKESARSVYVLGAENGLVLGPVLTLAALLVGATTYNALMFVPAVIALIAVPAVAYMQLRRTMATQPSLATFSALWLQGICAFFFGGAIMAALCYAAMRWIWPGFIIDQVQTVIEIYGAVNDPEAQDIARTLQRLMDSHSLPAAIDIALELLYVAVFTGSLLSMLLSLIIRKTRRLKPPQFKQ